MAIAWLAFIIGLSAAKSAGYGSSLWGGIEVFLGGNKQMHFAMACVLSFLAHLAFPASRFRLVTPVLMILVLGCVTDELLQYYLPTRHFNLYDFAASLLGLIAGYCIFHIVSHTKVVVSSSRSL
ncbi:VanZ family protein [Endozoicomonas sp. OPT23]|uniref:VanZ family protein n=1 Tax=Endozoicomonas sp. OPT23 TaxID=2072845 RepID=UPI001890ED1A|nr:VanZ family protein [Endozoicomonas sp. OPT23]